MISKHTPGPWTVEHDYMPFVINGGGSIVASVTGTAAIRPEAPANARLMAAAPELLAALKLAREAVVIYGNVKTDERLVPTLDAAIAKASP